MATPGPKLGEIMIAKGWITQKQLEEGLTQQKRSGEFLGLLFLKRGIISETQLAGALSEQFRMPLITIKDHYIDWDQVMKYSSGLIVECRCFPFFQDEKSIYMAVSNPLNAQAMSRAEEEAKFQLVQFVLILESEMEEMIRRYQQQANLRIRRLFDEKG
jgi:hypothetical protein